MSFALFFLLTISSVVSIPQFGFGGGAFGGGRFLEAFERNLPPQTVSQLRAIRQDSTLSWMEKARRFRAVMSALPDSVLQRLPLPPFLQGLPPDVQSRFKAVFMDRSLNWQEKSQKIRSMIQSLPPDQRKLVRPRFLERFESYLPAEAANRLKAIREDDSLSWQQKRERYSAVVNSLPDSVLDRVPLPPFLQSLPLSVQSRFKAVYRDRSLNWQQKRQRIQAIVQSLSPEYKKFLPPRLTSGGFQRFHHAKV